MVSLLYSWHGPVLYAVGLDWNDILVMVSDILLQGFRTQ